MEEKKSTSVGKEEGGVVEGNDRARLPVHMVLAFLEEVDEGVSDALRRPLQIESVWSRHGGGRRSGRGGDAAKME